jgi:hypothetical protein
MNTLNGGALTPAAHDALWKAAKQKQTPYGEAVAQEPVVKMLMASWLFIAYYMHTNLYKPAIIRKWVHTSAAVST